MRSIVLTMLMALAHSAPLSAETMTLQVAGSVSATGNIQQNKEQPFFESVGRAADLPWSVAYSPIDRLDMDPEEALDLIRHGVVDIASLGVAVISKRDPFFLGLDVVGLVPDYPTAQLVVAAYSAPLAAHLRSSYNAHLLGIWPFGPQVLFCKPEIDGLAQLNGLKVRVYDANLGALIEHLGAVPVPIKFAQVQRSLALDVVDCAITGPSSANTAGWVDEAKVMLPIGFQIAFNAYAINLDRWLDLSEPERERLTAAFDLYIDDVWAYSEELYEDALRCNVGRTPCRTVSPGSLREIAIDDSDRDLVRASLTSISLPAWTASCESAIPGCSELWRDSIGRALGIE